MKKQKEKTKTIIYPKALFPAFNEILVLGSSKNDELYEHIHQENKCFISTPANEDLALPVKAPIKEDFSYVANLMT